MDEFVNINHFMNKKMIFFINDQGKVQRKDLVLVGYDDTNYYTKYVFGQHKGKIIIIPKMNIVRIEPYEEGGMND